MKEGRERSKEEGRERSKGEETKEVGGAESGGPGREDVYRHIPGINRHAT